MKESKGRPPEIERATHTSLRLSEELLADLDSIALREGTNRSEVLRSYAWLAIDDFERDITHIHAPEWREFKEAQADFLKSQNVFMRRLLVLFGGLLFIEVALPYVPQDLALGVAGVIITLALVIGISGYRDRTPPPELPEEIEYKTY
jgi:hypothetical protein